MTYQRILVAIDASEPSQVALDAAISLAETGGAALFIITVNDERFLLNSADGQDVVEVLAAVETEEREGGELLERARASAAAAGVSDVFVQLLKGDPAARVVEAARAHRADIIIVSTHARTGLVRFFVGSVAEHVIRHAPCSVLVARSSSSEEYTRM